MVQVAYIKNVVPDFQIGDQSEIQQVALIHAPDTVDPYVGVYVQVQAMGSFEMLGTAGRLEIMAVYTDGSAELLTDSNAPFLTYSIPNQTMAWVLVHGNGQVASHAAPEDNVVLVYSSVAADNEQLRYNSAKILRKVQWWWTDDPL